MVVKYKNDASDVVAFRWARKILKRHSDDFPKIDGILYEHGIPSVVYRMLSDHIFQLEKKLRIAEISENTGLDPKTIRTLLRDYTFSEIESGCKDGKVCIKDLYHYEK